MVIFTILREDGGPRPTLWNMLVTPQTFHRTVPVLASPGQLAGMRVYGASVCGYLLNLNGRRRPQSYMMEHASNAQTFHRTVPVLARPASWQAGECMEQVSVGISSILMEGGCPSPT